jgi:hypothetical protein
LIHKQFKFFVGIPNHGLFDGANFVTILTVAVVAVDMVAFTCLLVVVDVYLIVFVKTAATNWHSPDSSKFAELADNHNISTEHDKQAVEQKTLSHHSENTKSDWKMRIGNMRKLDHRAFEYNDVHSEMEVARSDEVNDEIEHETSTENDKALRDFYDMQKNVLDESNNGKLSKVFRQRQLRDGRTTTQIMPTVSYVRHLDEYQRINHNDTLTEIDFKSYVDAQKRQSNVHDGVPTDNSTKPTADENPQVTISYLYSTINRNRADSKGSRVGRNRILPARINSTIHRHSFHGETAPPDGENAKQRASVNGRKTKATAKRTHKNRPQPTIASENDVVGIDNIQSSIDNDGREPFQETSASDIDQIEIVENLSDDADNDQAAGSQSISNEPIVEESASSETRTGDDTERNQLADFKNDEQQMKLAGRRQHQKELFESEDYVTESASFAEDALDSNSLEAINEIKIVNEKHENRFTGRTRNTPRPPPRMPPPPQRHHRLVAHPSRPNTAGRGGVRNGNSERIRRRQHQPPNDATAQRQQKHQQFASPVIDYGLNAKAMTTPSYLIVPANQHNKHLQSAVAGYLSSQSLYQPSVSLQQYLQPPTIGSQSLASLYSMLPQPDYQHLLQVLTGGGQAPLVHQQWTDYQHQFKRPLQLDQLLQQQQQQQQLYGWQAPPDGLLPSITAQALTDAHQPADNYLAREPLAASSSGRGRPPPELSRNPRQPQQLSPPTKSRAAHQPQLQSHQVVYHRQLPDAQRGSASHRPEIDETPAGAEASHSTTDDKRSVEILMQKAMSNLLQATKMTSDLTALLKAKTGHRRGPIMRQETGKQISEVDFTATLQSPLTRPNQIDTEADLNTGLSRGSDNKASRTYDARSLRDIPTITGANGAGDKTNEGNLGRYIGDLNQHVITSKTDETSGGRKQTNDYANSELQSTLPVHRSNDVPDSTAQMQTTVSTTVITNKPLSSTTEPVGVYAHWSHDK